MATGTTGTTGTARTSGAARPARRRRGRPPASDGPSTEERILRSARELFGELGYERCTFSQVAERAGLTRPAINHYFAGKKELFEAVFDSVGQRVVTAGVVRARDRRSVSGKLTAFLDAASQIGSGDPSYARFITSSLLDGSRQEELAGRTSDHLEQVRVFVAGALREGIASGEVRSDLDIAAVTEMLVALLWGMGLYAGFVGTPDRLESVVSQFDRLLRADLW